MMIERKKKIEDNFELFIFRIWKMIGKISKVHYCYVHSVYIYTYTIVMYFINESIYLSSGCRLHAIE